MTSLLTIIGVWFTAMLLVLGPVVAVMALTDFMGRHPRSSNRRSTGHGIESAHAKVGDEGVATLSDGAATFSAVMVAFGF